MMRSTGENEGEEMKVPAPYDPEISVNWGIALLLLPLVFMVPEFWGGYFCSWAIVLL
jgi:hypothetical protein